MVVVCSVDQTLLALCLLSCDEMAQTAPLCLDGQLTSSEQWLESQHGICVTSLPEHLTASMAPFRALFSPFAMLTDILSDGGCSVNPNPVLGDGELAAKPIHDEGVSEWERNLCKSRGRFRGCLRILTGTEGILNCRTNLGDCNRRKDRMSNCTALVCITEGTRVSFSTSRKAA